ncbi:MULTISPECIES: endo alpha-1,4 polygalactosaminidase [unclassified Rhizobium]|jgi:hypothetical protein|uniref:endo alpha-1,4 polygalactosaminidase n=1 Tax=unclassified Rhizobium TaxID=2613769 RepID=UPI00068E8B31|nr:MULTISPECIES: endo alpha-1,4 polygalactosaminidase [unclassified Rhizobium]OJY79651.1 MAG: hypothetical protein BGP09_08565 [Rhizobium sp. 60-20]RKD50712.1 glycosyl hydrolase family 114 [Rhizobium sp. WW_1]
MRFTWFHATIIATITVTHIVMPASVQGAQSVLLPPVKGQFDYQLGGDYQPTKSAAIVVRDREVKPVKDKYNICYVNAFQTQPDDGAWWTSKHPDLLVRKNDQFVIDKKWNEYLFDTSTDVKRTALMRIVGPWFDKCATDGFKGIDADNLDSWTRSEGVLSEKSNVEFAKLLVKRAHAVNLAIAQKNAGSLASIGHSKIGFDFAIVEECQVWSECNSFTDAYPGEVYEIEYNDNNKDADGNPVDPISFFNAACAAHGKQISVIYRDRDLVPFGSPGYEYKVCK